MLHLLLFAALNNPRRPEGMSIAVEKIKEIVDSVWPAGTPRETDIVRHGRLQLLVSKDLEGANEDDTGREVHQ